MRAYLQLFRLPNVFTAFADVLMGYWFVWGDRSTSPAVLLLLAAASGLLYIAGMVLNDVFDLEQDREERPARPIPSGRVPLGRARLLGFGLLLAGIAAAWVAALLMHDFRAGWVALGLAAAIVAYDAILKRTPLGPIAMGSCRTLNVLLGMSALEGSWGSVHLLVAAGLGVYIVGVTWFARTEARSSNVGMLIGGLVVMEAGIAMLVQLHAFGTPLEGVPFLIPQRRWQLLLVLLGIMIGWRCLRAIIEPIPARVQMAVKNSILSLVVLDAALCAAARGLTWQPVVIVALLIPATLLGRWIYST